MAFMATEVLQVLYLINPIPILQNDRMVEVDTDHCRSSNPIPSIFKDQVAQDHD